MPEWKSLTRSIVRHGAFFFLAQAGVLVAMTLAFGMGWARLTLFLGVSLVFHAFLTAMLLLRRGDFRIEATGLLLSRVNLSNTLTYIRLSSLPTILYLVIQASDFPTTLTVILPLICAVFATDFLDGMTARKRGEITFVGRYLDSASDYLTIIAVTIVLNYHGLLPLWFLLLVLVRLVLFAVGMGLLALREGKADPRSTFVGKVSVFSLMVSPPSSTKRFSSGGGFPVRRPRQAQRRHTDGPRGPTGRGEKSGSTRLLHDLHSSVVPNHDRVGGELFCPFQDQLGLRGPHAGNPRLVLFEQSPELLRDAAGA
ncbi:MAG: CDP-alcohol phosphatidyltransferase family protein [Spirochaetia bacterium]